MGMIFSKAEKCVSVEHSITKYEYAVSSSNSIDFVLVAILYNDGKSVSGLNQFIVLRLSDTSSMDVRMSTDQMKDAVENALKSGQQNKHMIKLIYDKDREFLEFHPSENEEFKDFKLTVSCLHDTQQVYDE